MKYLAQYHVDDQYSYGSYWVKKKFFTVSGLEKWLLKLPEDKRKKTKILVFEQGNWRIYKFRFRLEIVI